MKSRFFYSILLVLALIGCSVDQNPELLARVEPIDGQDGDSSSIEVVDLPVGSEQCPNGGIEIIILLNGEPQDSRVICNGVNGEDGADGQDGSDGSNGEDGSSGNDGTNGEDGSDGEDGQDGINCWDLNGNGENDLEEDVNGDGEFTALDCQAPDPLILICKKIEGEYFNIEVPLSELVAELLSGSTLGECFKETELCIKYPIPEKHWNFITITVKTQIEYDYYFNDYEYASQTKEGACH